MSLNDIDIAKFKEGFNQFSAQEIRTMFSVLKGMVYNSSGTDPINLTVDEQQGIRVSLAQDVGNLVKAKAIIADDATGKVVLTDILFNEIGEEFDAKNLSGNATTNNQTKLVLGQDPGKVFFFRDSEGGGEVCDCQNALSFEECWNFAWLQELNDMNSIGGGFDVLMKWELTDLAGNLFTSCDDIIQSANCEETCDFAWKLTQDGEPTQTMESHPFTGNGADFVDIVTPWNAIVSYGFGFNPSQFTIVNPDCGDTSVDLFGISPAVNSQCPAPTGEVRPCELFDPRQACIDGCI